jgi:hypothetical protein
MGIHFRFFLSLLLAGGLANLLFAQPQGGKNGPAPAKGDGAAKSELADEDTESASTPPTLRVVLALLLIAGVVAVVVVPSRKGGGDTR